MLKNWIFGGGDESTSRPNEGGFGDMTSGGIKSGVMAMVSKLISGEKQAWNCDTGEFQPPEVYERFRNVKS